MTYLEKKTSYRCKFSHFLWNPDDRNSDRRQQCYCIRWYRWVDQHCIHQYLNRSPNSTTMTSTNMVSHVMRRRNRWTTAWKQPDSKKTTQWMTTAIWRTSGRLNTREGTQQIFIRGGSAPRSNLLPFYIPFFMKKVPLSSIFYWQMVPLSHALFRTLQPF